MKLFDKTLKIAVAAFFMLALPAASFADHQRTPNPAPVVKTSGMSKAAVAKFLKAFPKNVDNAYSLSGEPTATNTRPIVTSRPKSILKSPEAPTGNMYALVPYHYRSTSYNDGYYAKLDMSSYTLVPEFSNPNICNGSDYYFQAAAERNGLLYTPAYDQNMITNEITIYWKVFDTETGNSMPDIVFDDVDNSMYAFMYNMTYDPIHDMFYGLAYDFTSGIFGAIVEIDPKQPKWEPRVVSTSYGYTLCAIAYNPDDQMLYGLSEGGELVLIDYFTGPLDVIPLAQYDDFYDYYMFPDTYSANAFCYSPYDHAFLLVYRDSFEQKMILAAVDAETYQAYELGEVTPLGYISAFICRDAYADDNAPDIMATPAVNFDKASLSGTYTLRTPATTFAGVALSGNVQVHVLLDGVEIENFSAKPDTEYTKQIDTLTGMHNLAVYSTIDTYESPKATVDFYVGYDSTLPPTKLALDRNVLTWNAPGAEGAHKGYVDMDDITYNVYFNGNKINTTPIKDTKFEFQQPETMERKAITVTSETQGMESEPSLPLSRTVGVALDLPFSMQPANRSEAALFETYNADGDDNEFEYYTSWDGFNCYTIRTNYYYQHPEDWVFLPAISLDDPAALYQLAVKYANSYMDDRYLDCLDIYIGTRPDPKAMVKKVYSHKERNTPDVTDLITRFTIPAADDYVIGFHTYGGETSKQYRGVLLYDFDVRKCDNATAATPDAPTDVTLTAGKNGALEVTADFTAPTLDLSGNKLAADTDITVTATTTAGKGSTIVKPGQKGSITVPVADNGINEVYIFASSKEGEGISNFYSTYVGLDTPLPPTNVTYTIDKDNLGVNISWEAPEGGQNGGYINKDDLKYGIYSLGSAGNYSKISDVDGFSYHYTTEPGKQAYYHVGPVASNEMGSSINGAFVYEALGTPYKIPMVEEWNNAGFSYSKWIFSTTGEYAQSDVQSVSSGAGLGIGDPTFARDGGMLVLNTGGFRDARYQIIAPKFTTEDVQRAKISLRIWDYPQSGSVELWGRTSDNDEYKLIQVLDLPHDKGQWLEIETPLPDEYIGKSWVQVNLRGDVPGNGYVLFDNYQALQDIETDFTVVSLDGPTMTTVGETAQFNLVIANSGSEPASTTIVFDILGDGNVIDSQTVEVGRTLPGENYVHTASFDIGVNYLDYRKLTARATITHDDDQNANNNVISMEFVVNPHAMPVIGDLQAERDGQDVILTWSKPDTSYGSPESFEVMPAFTKTEKLGLWTNLDGDKGNPFAIDGLRFDGDDTPCGWIVWDGETMNTMNDERLKPHAGRKTVLARSIGYNESTEKPIKSFDWLISPEIVPGSSVSFWYNTLSAQYTETVELWVSYTDNVVDFDNIEYDANGNPVKCGSFVKLRNYTKSGSEAWEFCMTPPLRNVRYFAFVYGSIGQFGAMLDDIIFTPANSYNWDIDSYEVLRKLNYGRAEVIATDIKDLTFRDTNDALNSTYWVRSVVYSDGLDYRSPLSNEVRIEGSSVSQLGAGSAVEGGNACVILTNLEGHTAELFDADGRNLCRRVIGSNRQTIPAPAGVVLVKVDNTFTKVMVK